MISAFFKANPVLAWLLSAVVVIAAGTGIYYASQSNRMSGGEQVATLPKAVKSDSPAGTEKPASAAPQAEAPKEAAPQAELAEPRFDVLRVEKDGSTVIAGTGPSSSRIEIESGGKVLAWTMSDPGGNFAIVFDKPLEPGDHELSISATTDDGTKVASTETGVVHVPAPAGTADAGGGEVIAMVTKEGGASRVLQAPESAASTEPASDARTTEAGTAEETKPAVAGGEQQVASTEPAPKPSGEAAAEKPAATEPVAEKPAEEPAKSDLPVLVKAVDVDSGKLFVAGSGQPGRNVNIYLDGKFLGATKVGPEGGFLLEAAGDIAAGTHEIRADMLADGSTEVTNRAVVPLIHEVPGSPTEVASAETPKADVAAKPETASAEPAAREEPATPQAVTPAAQTAARTEEPAAEKPAGAMASGEQATSAESAKPMAKAEPSAGETIVEKSGTMAAGEEKPAGETPMASATAEKPATETATAEQPAETKPATGAQTMTKTAEVPAEKPATTEERMAAEPKQEMASAEKPAAAASPEPIRTGANVIIRRGDNLWQISRRMLGAGVKYTVIYEANRDQIRDPHWIYPGQVFDVPGGEGSADKG